MSADKDRNSGSEQMLAMDKASVTDRAARQILADEAEKLQSKTLRLRRLRLERDARERGASSGTRKRSAKH